MNIGDSFGNLTIINIIEEYRINKKRKYIICKCNCGNECKIRMDSLHNRFDCGCKWKIDKRTRGGLSSTKIFKSYHHMVERCYNPKNSNFPNYGGRGIIVCNEWRSDFLKFYKWAISMGYKDGLTIERYDNNMNYCPENCTWIPKYQQAANRRSNHLVTAFGETKTIKLWSQDDRCNVKCSCLMVRINKGMSPELAITTKNMK